MSKMCAGKHLLKVFPDRGSSLNEVKTLSRKSLWGL